MNKYTDEVFKEVNIEYIKADKNPMLSEIDGVFFVATNKKTSIIKYYDEYIGIDCNSIFITDDITSLENNEDLIVFVISGALYEKYLDQDIINSVLKFSANSKVMRIVSSIINEELDLNDIDLKKKFSLAMDILIDIVFYDSQICEQTNRVVNDALFYIHEHYYEIYGIEQLADALHVSESYLIRMFKKQMDITPLKYIQQIKVEKAKQFLLQQALDLKTIAGLCGYSNANYFGKVFKKISGITPGEYRELHQVDMHESLPDKFYL